MRIRSPSRRARCGLAWSPFTSTLPLSHPRLASDRVLYRHATSSQASTRMRPPSDQDFDFALGAQRGDERGRFALPVLLFEELRHLVAHVVERRRLRRLLLDHLDDVEAELRLDQ